MDMITLGGILNPLDKSHSMGGNYTVSLSCSNWFFSHGILENH